MFMATTVSIYLEHTDRPNHVKLRERIQKQSTTFDVALRNLGDDAARHGILRAIVYLYGQIVERLSRSAPSSEAI